MAQSKMSYDWWYKVFVINNLLLCVFLSVSDSISKANPLLPYLYRNTMQGQWIPRSKSFLGVIKLTLPSNRALVPSPLITLRISMVHLVRNHNLVFGIDENEVLVHVFDVEVVEFKLFSFHPSPLKPSPNLITLQLQGSSTLIFLKKAQYIFIKKHLAFGSFLQWNRFEFQWIIGKDYLQDTATSYWTKKKGNTWSLWWERRGNRSSKLKTRALYNNPSDSWWSYRSNLWSHVVFIIQQLWYHCNWYKGGGDHQWAGRIQGRERVLCKDW